MEMKSIDVSSSFLLTLLLKVKIKTLNLSWLSYADILILIYFLQNFTLHRVLEEVSVVKNVKKNFTMDMCNRKSLMVKKLLERFMKKKD